MVPAGCAAVSSAYELIANDGSDWRLVVYSECLCFSVYAAVS